MSWAFVPGNSPRIGTPEVPPILANRSMANFWLASVCTGAATGLATAALLEQVQHAVWPGAGYDLLEAASHAGAVCHVLVLLGAGLHERQHTRDCDRILYHK